MPVGRDFTDSIFLTPSSLAGTWCLVTLFCGTTIGTIPKIKKQSSTSRTLFFSTTRKKHGTTIGTMLFKLMGSSASRTSLIGFVVMSVRSDFSVPPRPSRVPLEEPYLSNLKVPLVELLISKNKKG